MAYWLFKSEPNTWGWDDQVKKGAPEEWDGVRNYQARNNMREMKVGELGFFYHSIKEKRIVGIVRVAAEAHPDSKTDDERWECVDIEAVKQANADLVGTIQESLQIADEGKARRAAAEEELKKMEGELRDTLAAAKARKDGVGDNAGTAVPG